MKELNQLMNGVEGIKVTGNKVTYTTKDGKSVTFDVIAYGTKTNFYGEKVTSYRVTNQRFGDVLYINDEQSDTIIRNCIHDILKEIATYYC